MLFLFFLLFSLLNGVLEVLNLKLSCVCLTMLVTALATSIVILWLKETSLNHEMTLKSLQQFHHLDTFWKKKKTTNKGKIFFLPSFLCSKIFIYQISIFSLWKKGDLRKGGERNKWLNSPNVYQKVEILETGTQDPKRITKVEVITFENK